jgi:hypothetical protein
MQYLKKNKQILRINILKITFFVFSKAKVEIV